MLEFAKLEFLEPKELPKEKKFEAVLLGRELMMTMMK